MSGRGHSTDNARELGQKVYSYRSDRRIALKFFHKFSKAIFDVVAWNRYDRLTTSGLAHSIDNTREPCQKVHTYRSDRWIALKCFTRVSGGCFRWRWVESVRHVDGVRLGHSTDNTRELGQKVPKYRSVCWIALKFCSRVSGGCFRWSCVESVRHANGVRSGPFHRQP